MRGIITCLNKGGGTETKENQFRKGVRRKIPSLKAKDYIRCINAQVIACPFCETKGVISNMHRENMRFKCDTCKTELLIDKW